MCQNFCKETQLKYEYTGVYVINFQHSPQCRKYIAVQFSHFTTISVSETFPSGKEAHFTKELHYEHKLKVSNFLK